jgi:nitrite reductase/ring-hydroxylating ferredoxin subunit
LPTAASGLADWLDTAHEPRSRRVGIVHAATNSAALACYATSLVLRGRDRRGAASVASGAGALLLAGGGYLGGHLVFRLGLGVDRTAFEHGPEDWTRVAAAADLAAGKPRRVEADGRPIMLLRADRDILAVADTCTHLGCSLSEGELEGDEVTCPCHGSRFRVTDGEVLEGPAATPLRQFDVDVRDADVYVRERP